jgi:hypothetical protein
MKRTLYLILLIVFFMSIIVNSVFAKPIIKSQSIGNLSKVKIIVANTDSNIKANELSDIKSKAEKAKNEIAKYFGIKDISCDIRIHIQAQCLPEAYKTDIFLSKWHMDRKFPELVHEMTHSLMALDSKMNSTNTFFLEGTAQLMEETFGEKTSFSVLTRSNKFIRVPVYDILKVNKKYYIPISKLINQEFLTPTNEEEVTMRHTYYAECGSFFVFLQKKYGNNKIKELYNSKNELDFKNVYSKDINMLEKEWKAYFKLAFL